MSTIPVSQIVSVTPGVLSAGGAAVNLLGMTLTTNTRVPTGGFLSFPTAAAVSSFFGPASNEAALAAVYFAGYDNKTAVPAAMLFTQYPITAGAGYLRSGNVANLGLPAIQAMTGTLTVLVDGYTHTASGLVLSSASSFSAAAALIQTGLTATEPTEATFTGAIAGNTLTVSAVASGTLSVGQTLAGTGVAAGTVITALVTGAGLTGTYTTSGAPQTVASEAMTGVATAPTVTYDPTSGAFVVTSGITGAPSTAAFATGSLAALLLMTSATGATLSQGAAAAVPGPFMNALILQTQNWATFFTAFDPDGGSGNTQKQLFAAWTNSTQNRFAYICFDTDITPTLSTQATSSLGYILQQSQSSGTILIYEPSDLGHAAFVSGMIASINTAAVNGRITLMGKHQVGLVAGVSNAGVAANLIANGYNLYGAYGAASANFVFFNPGSISGPFEWADSYINQIWLNASFQQAGITFLTSIGSAPYNAAGYSLVEACFAGVIAAGLSFGAFRAGVTLSALQISEVNNAAGVAIDTTLSAQGWYLQIQPAPPTTRQGRASPVINFWYCDGESIQKLSLNSVDVQ